MRQTPRPRGWEIIIADGLSEDGTWELLNRWKRTVEERPSPLRGAVIRVLANPGRYVAPGLNAAIRAATGQVIIRMDAHTEYAPDYVRQCLAHLQATGADNVGGPARTKPATYVERAIAAAYHSWFSVGGARFHNPGYAGYVDTVPYGCWRAQAFRRFGFFDEELVRNQDDEHNLRILRGGGKIWQTPEIKSWYRPRGSLQALFRQYAQYGYWKVRVIQKHRLPASWRHLVPGLFILSLVLLAWLAAGGALLSCNFAPPLQRAAAAACLRLSSAGMLGLGGAYLLTVLLASLATAARVGWKLLPLLPVVFCCYHFGYGLGFLWGVWRFLIVRRKVEPRAALPAR